MKSSGNGPTVSLTPLAQPVCANVTVPGSKSYTIRALLLAALAKKMEGQPVHVLNPLLSDDTQAVMSCLNTLGIRTELKPADAETVQQRVEVYGSLTEIADQDYTLNADLSAATLRFLLALSAVIPGRQTLLGREGLNKRPVRDLVDSLRAVGVQIEYLENEGYPPVRVSSSAIQADVLQISGSTSSQYISGLMMIAPLVQSRQGQVVIELPGEPVSKPYLDMTMSILEAFGITVINEDYHRFVIPDGQQYQATQYVVEPDASSMAYFLAIAALTRSTITIRNINPDSAQADMRLLDILQQMGNQVQIQGDRLTLQGQGVEPLHINMQDCPDQAQTVAVLAAFANGVTRIDGLQSLRVKETDRIAAVEQELRKMGIRVEAEPDALVIHGGQPKAARIATYGDHRMAMAFAVAGALLPGLEIEDKPVVNKTYPGFWQDLQALGVGVQDVQPSDSAELSTLPAKIAIIGFMGSGKSSVAKLIAQQLDWELLEMDSLLLQQSGRASISDIFEQDGEAHFRTLERELALSLKDAHNVVISTGGGVVTSEITMQALQENGVIVLLDASLATITARLAQLPDRPLLKNPEQIRTLFEQRKPLYDQYAQVRVDANTQTPAQLAEAIIQAIQNPVQANVCTV